MSRRRALESAASWASVDGFFAQVESLLNKIVALPL